MTTFLTTRLPFTLLALLLTLSGLTMSGSATVVAQDMRLYTAAVALVHKATTESTT